MKTKVVVFTSNNARILTNPSAHPEGGLVNPDLSLVRGCPPHFWKLVHGKILPMTTPEKALRMAHIELHGVDNSENTLIHKERFYLPLLLWGVFLAGLCLGVWIG